MKALNKNTLVLSSFDIAKIVTEVGLDQLMDILIKRLYLAFESFDPKQTVIPIRSGFNYTKPALGLVEWMPLYDVNNQVVIKLVGYHPDNPANFDLPTVISTISSYDTTTGHLKGIMDAVFLTALRTGAASAVASKVMAHPDSKTLGLIGCGAQGITQLHAISRVFDLEQVMYYDTDALTLANFKQRCEILNLDIKMIPATMEEVVKNADILSTITSIDVNEGPLFSNIETKPHLHINAVGSDFPGKTELPLEFLKESFVCPDFTEQAIIEGECQQLATEDIDPNLTEVVKNRHSYTHICRQKSVFDSTGMPLEDWVAMEIFLEYAAEFKFGQEIALENITGDAKNPYEFLEIFAKI